MLVSRGLASAPLSLPHPRTYYLGLLGERFAGMEYFYGTLSVCEPSEAGRFVKARNNQSRPIPDAFDPSLS